MLDKPACLHRPCQDSAHHCLSCLGIFNRSVHLRDECVVSSCYMFDKKRISPKWGIYEHEDKKDTPKGVTHSASTFFTSVH